jgi:hypothetical protein
LSGERPFPDASVRFARKNSERSESEHGDHQHEPFHNSNALEGLEIEPPNSVSSTRLTSNYSSAVAAL